MQCVPPTYEVDATDVAGVSKEAQANKTKWTQHGSVTLTGDHKKMLTKEQWLDDAIVGAAQNILKVQFPAIPGLQSPILGDTLSMEPRPG